MTNDQSITFLQQQLETRDAYQAVDTSKPLTHRFPRFNERGENLLSALLCPLE
jgi:hypothetical protein